MVLLLAGFATTDIVITDKDNKKIIINISITFENQWQAFIKAKGAKLIQAP